MNIQKTLVQLLMVLSVTGCATGKAINSLDDVRDDGKRNVVLLTYDLNVYTTEKHSSVRDVKLVFRCPAPGDKLKPPCFSIDLPYLGTKDVDGFGLHAFELSGAKAIKMNYGNYSLQTASYGVVTDRIPVTSCYVSKKTKKNVCNTNLSDDTANHTIRFPSPAPIGVVPGSGCYIGHMNLSVADDRTIDYELDTQATLTADKLSNLSSDIADELIETVDRPC